MASGSPGGGRGDGHRTASPGTVQLIHQHPGRLPLCVGRDRQDTHCPRFDRMGGYGSIGNSSLHRCLDLETSYAPRPVSLTAEGPSREYWRFASQADTETGSVRVAPAGFEPAISALKGPRPRPLDDGACWIL